jgi:hypothetical protein
MYCNFANTGQADTMCSTASPNCLQNLHLLSVSVLIFFLLDILFVMLDLVLLLFHFKSLLSALPSTATGIFFANKLSIHTSNILAIPSFAFPFFV